MQFFISQYVIILRNNIFIIGRETTKLLEMRSIRKILLATAATLCCLGAGAQELNCTFDIDSRKVSNANKDIFNTLKEAVNEYLNTTVWTDAQFAANEKIECKMFLTVAEYDESNGRMKGDLQIQSTRPVYNSSYTTTLINFKDTKIALYAGGDKSGY